MRQLFFMLSMLGVSAAAQTAPVATPTIVLVHGAFETSQVWDEVAAKLKADGYRVVAVNLPGRPGAAAPSGGPTLAAYRDTVVARMAAEKAPVVLVGHSFGGFTVSEAAEAAPEKVRTVVYVAAYLPRSGESLLSLSQKDADSKMGPAFRVLPDKGLASVDPARRVDLFCNGCSDAAKAKVEAAFVDEPLAPPGTPATLSAERFGKVDKAYIHTARDQVVSPSLQAAMVAATPVRKEITLDTGHAPFAADPTGLARAIEASIR